MRHLYSLLIVGLSLVWGSAASAQAGPTLTLDGVNDYASLPYSALYDFGATDQFTVMTWVKLPATQLDLTYGDNNIIEGWNNTAVGYPFVLRINNQNAAAPGKIYFARYNVSSGIALTSTTPLNDNIWHHVAMVKDATTLRLYVDGVQQATAPDTIAAGTYAATKSGVALNFGRRSTGTTYMRGSLDSIHIFSQALSGAQIQAVMTTPLTAPTTGLVGVWNFSEGTGTTAADASGNNLTATFANGALWTAVVPIPTLSEWGMIAMFVLLSLTMWRAQKNRRSEV